jgi:hypothetical protein
MDLSWVICSECGRKPSDMLANQPTVSFVLTDPIMCEICIERKVARDRATHPVIEMSIPETFGDHTLNDMFYNLASSWDDRRHVKEVLPDILRIPIFLKVGFRTPKQLAFIAEQTLGFLKWAQENYGIELKITFV